ncbi:MAG: membrane anchor subunit of succinate dehydrogenase, Sdh4 [Peltula sp. TS41687]|nr:MAG: membrane anchor subunit of succinate dehydrogenase, Sdh4 [Peltula sp. TS41687]
MASLSRTILARQAFLSISTRQAAAPHHHHVGILSSPASQHLLSSPILLPNHLSGQNAAFRPVQIAGFHASASRPILPPPPQRIIGTGETHSKTDSAPSCFKEGLIKSCPSERPHRDPATVPYSWKLSLDIREVSLDTGNSTVEHITALMTVRPRLLAGALVPLTIAPFATGSLHPVMDAILAAAILIHSHVGFQSIIIDYIPQRRLRKTRLASWWALRAATLTVAVGIYEFETNDVGLTEAIKRIWKA